MDCKAVHVATPTSIHTRITFIRNSADIFISSSRLSRVTDVGLSESLQEEVSKTPADKGIKFDADLVNIFSKPHLTSPFEGLHTEFLRKKFHREKLSLVVSKNS